MPTYIYETLPAKARRKPKRFEIRQSIKENALTKHPDTGEPVRRIIAGGISVHTSSSSSGHSHTSACGCGAGGCGS